ncbi:MAG TPA: hypothetical protein VFQ34_08290 [Nitrospiraceae bacterium]|jgi:uncharacterized coiled-coil protein SlyX|nr:hypothetical protein [Nitrospiraceae bacterium]
MTKKQQRLAEKPIQLLTFVPTEGKKPGSNPLLPSPVRMAVRNMFVKLEDLTERFEDWCHHGRVEERALEPIGQRVRQWFGALPDRYTENQQPGDSALVPSRRWDGSVGDVIFRIRDRAGFVQRALMAQAREIKEWMIQHSQSTQAELNDLRSEVAAQRSQVEQLTAQLQDLRALVSSQQQVLMYMGEELDAGHGPDLNGKAMSSRNAASRANSASVDRRDAPADAAQVPYINA